jgi:hypothetical protein
MVVLFAILILIFTIPAWLPILSISPALWRARIAFTFSSLLQIAFDVCVGKQVLTLDYSLKFAAVGIPCCVMAVVLARADPTKASAYRRVALGATVGLAMWLFFITLH